jgi:hypothetical protein
VSTEVDHLVVAAATLEEGVRWCESTLGVTPAPGGTHPTMGTHNRLLSLSSAAFPRSYLEIIAIDPTMPKVQRLRWYRLDEAALKDRLATHGPQLINVSVRTTMIETHRRSLVNHGLNPGVPIAVHRDTPVGRLSWHVLARDDGGLEAGGLVPTLIQWDGPHATEQLPDQGCTLQSLRLDGLPTGARDVLRLANAVIDPTAAPAAIRAEIATPRGVVALDSIGALGLN